MLRVGTLNVWGLPFDLAEDLEDRSRALARALPDLDIDLLAIQEAWTPALRERLVRAGRAAGFEHVAAPEAPSGGLILLSRLPLAEARFERFHFRGDLERIDRGEYLGGKGFQSARVDTPEGPIQVVNTHLHARYRRGRPWLNSAIRTAQLVQVVEHVQAIWLPVVLAGDLNCEPTDPEYAVLRGLTGLTDAAQDLGRPLPTVCRSNHYKRHRDSDRRIDYVMLRPGDGRRMRPLSTERVFDTPLDLGGWRRPVSDHFGVRVDVVVERGDERIAGLGPVPGAGELAGRLPASGREEALRSEGDHALAAGSCAAGPLLAGALRRDGRISRRGLLRRGMGALAAVSLAPALGFGALASYGGAEKRRAFAAAEATLSSLRSLPMAAEPPRPLRRDGESTGPQLTS